MKIVALDGHTLNPGDNPWEPVEALGDLTVYPRTAGSEILDRAAGATVLITNKTPLSREVIACLPELRFVTVSATGYDIIAIDAARERGIPVSNVPGYSSDSVAQHTFALLLEMTNQAGNHNDSVQSGDWVSNPDFSYWKASIPELSGKTLGIIGCGDIGQRVARIASAFGMNVLLHSRTRREFPATNWAWVKLDELAQRSDFVSLHCPQTAATSGIINADFLARMKPASFLINTARGGLVVERDLAEALRTGHLAGAALDVVAVEPMRADNPLLRCPNCIITPHLAWASLEARQRLMQKTAENIAAFQQGQLIHVVNGPLPGTT